MPKLSLCLNHLLNAVIKNSTILTRGEQPKNIKTSKAVFWYSSARPPKARGPGHLPGLPNMVNPALSIGNISSFKLCDEMFANIWNYHFWNYYLQNTENSATRRIHFLRIKFQSCHILTKNIIWVQFNTRSVLLLVV